MKQSKIIFIVFLLVFSSRAIPQSLTDTTISAFPLSIYTIECKPIGGDYVLDYKTHYSQYTIIDRRFSFEIEIRFKIDDNYSIPDSSIGVIIQTWSGEKENYVLKPKNFILKFDKNYYDYVFEFDSDRRNYATCNIVWYNKTNNSFGPVNYSNTNVSRGFLLH